MTKALTLVTELGKNVKLYRMGCTMQPSAAQVAYYGMNENEDGSYAVG
jgi:hypothetical protein